MKTIYKTLNYEGPIHTLRRWTQYLLAYSFTCLHHLNTMMQDVDVILKYYNPLVAVHIALLHVYQIQDKLNRKDAYSLSAFDEIL